MQQVNQSDQSVVNEDNNNPFQGVRTYSMGCFFCLGTKLKALRVMKTGLVMDLFGCIILMLKQCLIWLVLFDENWEQIIYVLWPFFFMIFCIMSLRNLLKFMKKEHKESMETIKKVISNIRCYNFARIIFTILGCLNDLKVIIYMTTVLKEGIVNGKRVNDIAINVYVSIVLQSLVGLYWLVILFFSCVLEAAINSINDFNNKLIKDTMTALKSNSAIDYGIRISNISMERDNNTSQVRDDDIINITMQNDSIRQDNENTISSQFNNSALIDENKSKLTEQEANNSALIDENKSKLTEQEAK